MTPPAGTRLGPQILAPIGAGGRGEVYRARKLDRDVAKGLTRFAAVCMMLGAGARGGPSQTISSLQIKTLSSRPDLVSGGDALVEVRAPAGTSLSRLTLTLNAQDVTGQLKGDPKTGRFRGLISGLTEGANLLRASITPPDASSASAHAALTITNYPITGPILSGPHLTPYECRTVESGLGPPLDADCSAASQIQYFYGTSGETFKPLADPAGPLPLDLASTTTNDGTTVPYIVRLDSGTINRTIYRIAILDDPKRPGWNDAAKWTPGPGWNRKLAVGFGVGAGTEYNQGVIEATDALSHPYLSRGFAFLTATELVNGLHTNAVLQGETLMMLKEYFIERYGEPKWTVGDGLSGGAIVQLVVAEIYPGLLDGLQPALAYPDSTQYADFDCRLFQRFWRKADSAVWTDARKAAVEGYAPGTCGTYELYGLGALYSAGNAERCALNDPSRVYDPVKNPSGARCTLQDMRANIYGRDPATGFARKPQDNVGVQYGLAALNAGAIGVAEFLELNQKIGGTDIDGNFIPQRSVGDPVAIRGAYESGLLNSGGGGLATVPILHWRPYKDSKGDIHDRIRDLAIRARLQKTNGRSDNQVIWVGPPGEEDQPEVVDLASLSLDTMNCWLDNMAADPSPFSTDKVARNKPDDAVDAFWDRAGNRFNEAATIADASAFNRLYPVHSEPRIVAGAPPAIDIIKCKLKPIDDADYKVEFNGAEKARLKSIFPSGVCDFRQPGVEQVPLQGTYRRY